MSVRLISQKGQTDSLSIGHPAVNMKWIVKWAVIALHTSTTTGSRSATLIVFRGNLPLVGPYLASIPTQTGTSITYTGIGDVSPQGGNYGGGVIQFSQFPEVFAVDVINLQVNLISGDTVDYYIMVEEVST